MHYLKSLFFNFLTVFFANHILPGIDVVNQTKLPHLGGDLIFAFALGILNTLIYPVLRLVDHSASALKIGLIALILNFASYAILKLLPIGIQITTIEGYLLASVVVAIGSFVTNYLDMKHGRHHHKADSPHAPNPPSADLPQ
ncbi:MAG: phage holin family protein [Chlamydiota bacterium]